MAGGMGRSSFGSMADRVARTRGEERVPPPPPTPAAPPIKPCWVTDRHGRLPGLLLEWRQYDGAWRGRVVRPVLEDGTWHVVEEWLPAGFLEPAR